MFTIHKNINTISTIAVFIAIIVVFIIPILLSGSLVNKMFIMRLMSYAIIIPILHYYSVKSISTTSNIGTLLSIILSILFSQFLIIGEIVYVFHSIQICNSFWVALIYWSLSSIVLFIILRPIVEKLLYFLYNLKLRPSSSAINYRFLFFVSVSIRVLCFLLFYPCLFDFDAGLGLRIMLDPDEVVSNHHPYAVQLVHAIFYNWGFWLGDPTYGLAFLSIIFIFASSYIIIYLTKNIGAYVENQRWTKLVGYTLALFPVFPLLSITCTKDGFFAYCFLFYLATLIKIYVTNGACLKNVSFALINIIAIILICLTRHQGIYIVAIEFIVLIFTYKKYFKNILAISLFTLLLFFVYNDVYLELNHVEPTNKKETYNMLFQQTANYLRSYPDEVTKEEYEAISTVLNIDSITHNYEYNITDNVKKYYYWTEGENSIKDGLIHFRHVNHTGESIALKNYRKVWFKMLLKHPISYFDAWLCVISGFFYNNGVSLIAFDTNWVNSEATTPQYGFSQFKEVSNLVSSINGYLSNLPLFELIFGISFYNWCAIFLLSILIARRNKYILSVILPVTLSLCFLLLCPVASGRYEYPIIVSLPILFVLVVKKQNLRAYEENSGAGTML